MDTFQITLARGSEAEQFNDAFYRFLEFHSHDLEQFRERCGMMRSTPSDAVEEKMVRFWSAEAARDFRRFWRDRQAVARLRPTG